MSSEVKEIQLPTSQLKIGMNVIRLDRPWLESKFLLQGFVIRNSEELDLLVREHEFVYVEYTNNFESEFGLLATLERPASPTMQLSVKRGKGTTHKPRVTFEKEFNNATKQFHTARNFSKRFIENFRGDANLNIAEAREVVENCVNSLMNHPEALVWLTKIKNKDDYTAEHSMNVCVLAANFARHLGFSEAEIVEVGMCGLLHDVGKTQVPLEILNKPGKLTREEFQIIKNHPKLGRELLLAHGKTPKHVIDAAFSHHERENGSGYPRGLAGDEIALYSKIVAIADTYDAITSNRCYDDSRSSSIALKTLHQSRETLYDTELINEFIRCIGIYPPGSLVELKSGEIALVLKSNPTNRLTPRVLLTTDTDKLKLATPKQVETAIKVSEHFPYVIRREVPDGYHGINLQDYLELGLNANIA